MTHDRRPSIPSPPLPDDDGVASVALREALASYAAGASDGRAVMAELAASRVFVPVMAVLESVKSPDTDVLPSALPSAALPQEKSSSMATVFVDSAEHGRAMLAFTAVESLQNWRPDARPVPLLAPLAARAAVAEAAGTMIVDIAGPSPFAVAGDELLLLAAVAQHRDPDDGAADDIDPVLVTAVNRCLTPTFSHEFVAPDASTGGTWLLLISGRFDALSRQQLVDRLAHDPVVATLLPSGTRISFRDTPPAGPEHPALVE